MLKTLCKQLDVIGKGSKGQSTPLAERGWEKMADLRDDKVVRASYFAQLFDVEGTDLKRVYEPLTNQIGYVFTFIILLMLCHFGWKRYCKWKEEKKAEFNPYKVVKPPSSMVTDNQSAKGEDRKRVCAVVGGTGFIGSHVVNELVRRKNYYVFVLGRTFRPKRTNPDADCLIQVDLLDLDGLITAFQGVDSVINAAAVIPTVFSTADEIYRKNRLAYTNLIKAAKKAGVKNFVHVSGFKMKAKFKDPAFAAFFNAIYASEKDIVDANGEDGIQTCAIGPTNILGPNSTFIDRLVSGEMTSCPMIDKKPISFMPVEYLASALVNAEEKLATPATAASIAGKVLQLRGEPMTWKGLLTLPGWSQKISDTPRYVMSVLLKVNMICATLFKRAPFGTDFTPGILEMLDVVEEDVSEEEIQEVYNVLGVGPPHPPIADYVKQLVQQYKERKDDKKEQ